MQGKSASGPYHIPYVALHCNDTWVVSLTTLLLPLPLRQIQPYQPYRPFRARQMRTRAHKANLEDDWSFASLLGQPASLMYPFSPSSAQQKPSEEGCQGLMRACKLDPGRSVQVSTVCFSTSERMAHQCPPMLLVVVLEVGNYGWRLRVGVQM